MLLNCSFKYYKILHQVCIFNTKEDYVVTVRSISYFIPFGQKNYDTVRITPTIKATKKNTLNLFRSNNMDIVSNNILNIYSSTTIQYITLLHLIVLIHPLCDNLAVKIG